MVDLFLYLFLFVFSAYLRISLAEVWRVFDCQQKESKPSNVVPSFLPTRGRGIEISAPVRAVERWGWKHSIRDVKGNGEG